ncbi:hypothetical protein C7212DRAFT_175385, partial [Tuber magnatum]
GAGMRGEIVEMGRWYSLVTLDLVASSGVDYELRAPEGASINGGSNTEERLGDTYNTISNTGSPSQIMATLSLILPSRLVQFLSLKRTHDIARAALTIKRVTAQIIAIIAAGKSTLATSPEGSRSGDTLSGMLKSNTHTGPDGESGMRDQMMTFLAAGHETPATSITWTIDALYLRENRHIQPRPRAEIHATFPSGTPATIAYDQLGDEFLVYFVNIVYY